MRIASMPSVVSAAVWNERKHCISAVGGAYFITSPSRAVHRTGDTAREGDHPAYNFIARPDKSNIYSALHKDIGRK